jgi:hypothetical protein
MMPMGPGSGFFGRETKAMQPIWRIPGDALRKDNPIAGSVDDSNFCVTEISAGAWRAEGSDVHGRTVKREGPDRGAVLALCKQDARSMSSMIVP